MIDEVIEISVASVALIHSARNFTYQARYTPVKGSGIIVHRFQQIYDWLDAFAMLENLEGVKVSNGKGSRSKGSDQLSDVSATIRPIPCSAYSSVDKQMRLLAVQSQ